MYDVVILTDHRYENPKKIDWYIQQVLTEDKLLKKELELLGLNVIIKDWKSKKFDWTKAEYAIFRSTWDYFDNFKLFSDWLEKNKYEIKFINSLEIIKWNLDKVYLLELQEKGINIAPTILIKKNQPTTLKKLFEDTGWQEAVFKPTVSGAARHTYRINRNSYNDFEKIFKGLICNEDFLFQEFIKNIISNGELSLIVIGGKYTHAVKKTAKKGDFRVQDDHGGKVEVYHASDKEIEFAEQCINLCLEMPLYARVDIAYDNNNELSLVELELIEPELWFRNNNKSAKLLAEEILKKF
ncbi:hypothetical protein OA521_03550 [bacterium]|nr:hypothetical protein [bacterium]